MVYKLENLFLPGLEADGLRLGCLSAVDSLTVWFSGSPLLGYRFTAFSHGGELGREAGSSVALIRALTPFREAPPS